MNNTNMQPVRGSSALKKLCAIITFVVWSAVMLPAAHATVIILTGGDPGEGYTPGDIPVYAYHLTRAGEPNVNTTYNLQGVLFQPIVLTIIPPAVNVTSGSVTVANSIGYFSTGPSIGGSANDLALQGMNAAMGYGATAGAPTPMTLTLGGLVSGRTYQLDLFRQYGSGPNKTNTYSITDANGTIVETIPGVAATYYDVRAYVVANSFGNISIVATNSGQPDVPYLNAFSLTEVVLIPEPSTLLLFGVGGFLLWRQRRSS